MATSSQSPRGKPAPEFLRKSPTLRLLWRRMHVNNKNNMVALVGDPGSGKSWAALRLAELLDPGFNVDHVTFTPEELLERINSDQPIGDVTVADEAGVSMNAKTWWESDQIQIGNILETWRHQNRMLIFTLPVFTKLDKSARELMNFLLTSYGIDRQESRSKWRFQWVQVNNKTGERYFPYPKLPDPETGQLVKYKTLNLRLPSKELREAYQERKEAYTSKLNEEALEAIREDETDDSLGPKEVAAEIASEGIEPYISHNGNTGEPYINKQIIRVEYDLSHSNAEAVKSLLDKQFDLSKFDKE